MPCSVPCTLLCKRSADRLVKFIVRSCWNSMFEQDLVYYVEESNLLLCV
jgi:hypothetical protein